MNTIKKIAYALGARPERGSRLYSPWLRFRYAQSDRMRALAKDTDTAARKVISDHHSEG